LQQPKKQHRDFRLHIQLLTCFVFQGTDFETMEEKQYVSKKDKNSGKEDDESISNYDPDKEENPTAKKGPAKSGGTVDGIEPADKEEFENRERISKKAAEEEDKNRDWRKINRISDSGVRDDDDDGEDAEEITDVED
jgi:hypothetical protein